MTSWRKRRKRVCAQKAAIRGGRVIVGKILDALFEVSAFGHFGVNFIGFFLGGLARPGDQDVGDFVLHYRHRFLAVAAIAQVEMTQAARRKTSRVGFISRSTRLCSSSWRRIPSLIVVHPECAELFQAVAQLRHR